MSVNGAVRQLKSWLGTSGIAYKTSTTRTDLVVRDAQGQEVLVRIVPAGETTPGLSINEAALTNRNLQIALDAFINLQVQLGFEGKAPVDRGDAPTKKPSYREDFELVAFRHREFRRVKDPSPADLAKYEQVRQTAAWKFFRCNQTLVEDHMYELDDLLSFATIWTCIFIDRDQIEGGSEEDNQRLCYAFLRQRFGEFAKLLTKKGRNILAGVGTISACFDRPENEVFAYDMDGTPESEGGLAKKGTSRTIADTSFQRMVECANDVEDEEYVERHREIATNSRIARRASARKLLTEKLAALPEETRTFMLQQAVGNGSLDPVAREEAQRILDGRTRSLSETEEDEDSGADDALSAAE